MMAQALKTITPIGSCRIAGPLRVGAQNWGYDINRARTYGYTHSGLEAVQQVRFLQGDYHPSEMAWPLMSRAHDLSETKASPHDPSDLYVVEVSSQKELTVRGHAIQSNYLQKHFDDFFSDRERALSYWDAVDRQQAASWLQQNWGSAAGKAERQILSDLRRTMVTETRLTAQLSELVERLPSLVVVTHVNATMRSGMTISSRNAFINMVKRVAGALGILCYDPTELMGLWGQKASIEGGSDSLTHYTREFETSLIDDLIGFVGQRREQDATTGTITASISLGRQYQHQGTAGQAFKISERVLALEPTKARAEWVMALFHSSAEKLQIKRETIDLVQKYIGAGAAFELSADDTTRHHILSNAGDEGILEICNVVAHDRTAPDAITAIQILSTKCSDPSAIELCVAHHVSKWLGDLSGIEDPSTRLNELGKLHQLAPSNRYVVKAIRQTRKELRDEARMLFSAAKFNELDSLSEANDTLGFDLSEIDVLWCRSLQIRNSFEKSKPIATRLVEARPDHLTSWILLMRAARKTGAVSEAVRAAKQVRVLGEAGSPRYVEEAQTVLDAA